MTENSAATAATATPDAPTEFDTGQPSVREWFARHRRTIAVVALVLVAAALLAWSQRGTSRGFLDPAAFDDSGSHAAATLVDDRGVTVDRVTTTADAASALRATPGSTLFIAVPDLLQTPQIQELVESEPSEVVLIAPSDGPALSTFAPTVTASGNGDDSTLEPNCTWDPATLAGSINASDAAYRTASPSAIGCYGMSEGFGVVHLPATATTPWAATVIGDAQPFQNKSIAAHGNAAFAINVLSSNDHVIWYLPSYSELEAGQQSFADLAPRWVPFVAIQAFVVVLALAAWRVRRFGPVLVEPLPTRVPAAETIEGRGRMYRRTRSRDRAAQELRAGTIARLRRPCGFTASTSANEVVQVVADRISQSPTSVQDVLFGGTPQDDAALIALATALKELERNVQ